MTNEPQAMTTIATDGALPRRRTAPRLTPRHLARVRARDPRALADFFEATFDRVYGLAYRLLGTAPAADVVTEEVYVHVRAHAPRMNPVEDAVHLGLEFQGPAATHHPHLVAGIDAQLGGVGSVELHIGLRSSLVELLHPSGHGSRMPVLQNPAG